MHDKHSLRSALSALGLLASLLAALALSPLAARAGTTGVLEGTITDSATGKPIAGASITAASGSGSYKGTTDAHGFYSLQAMIPDTYTVSISAQGFSDVNIPGINVQQDQVAKLDQRLTTALKTIAQVQTTARNDLVQPYQGSDVYNVSGEQLDAAMGGTNTHETVYQYLDTVPGVSPIGGGFDAQPSIRGGYDVDDGYELDGVPITERQTGLFSTNLTNIGISNVEVITGGLDAANAGNGTGVINTVSKVGTYPGYFTVSAGMTSTEFNHYLRMELAGATKDGKYSWYMAFDGVNSQNYYWVGSTTPWFNVLDTGISSGNPGAIYTRDVLGNFHYRPDPRDDVQVLYLNSLFSDQANFNLLSEPGMSAFGLLPCAGSSGNNPTTWSHGSGGTAPNGEPCPTGLYYNWLPSGAGNYLGHYSQLAKVQWNHTINAKSSFDLRVSQMYNKYIFDQPYSDPNQPANNGILTGCPDYPYANGSPEQGLGFGIGYQCTFDLGDYYQNRTEYDYFLQGDYIYTPNENTTVKAGAGQEYDQQSMTVFYLNKFNYIAPLTTLQANGDCFGNSVTWPCLNQLSDNPSHVPYVYGQASFNIGKFTVQPGLRWSRIFYGIPAAAGGPVSAGFFAPSFVGTYRFNPKNVVRYSWSTSGQFIGSTFVYQLNNLTYDPAVNGAQAYQPSVNHIMDIQLEHAFDPQTSLRFGPYYRVTNNYPAAYQPFLGLKPGTNEWIVGPSIIADNMRIRDFGAELGVNHNAPAPVGVGWYLSATYNNYWTQLSQFAGNHVAFINFPLAQYFLDQGIFVRGTYSPLFSASLVADLHSYGWHFQPYIYWSYDSFYNTGGCLPLNAAGTGFVKPGQNIQPVYCTNQRLADGTYVEPVMAPEGIGMGYWWVNASLFKDIDNRWRVGISVQNLFNMQHGTTPCFNAAGSGCYPYGVYSGSQPPLNQYTYQTLTQEPRTYEVFATIRLNSNQH